MKLLHALYSFHFAYLRWLDVRILWPACKKAAAENGASLDHARAAFYIHAHQDRPWRWLGDAETRNRIDRLS